MEESLGKCPPIQKNLSFRTSSSWDQRVQTNKLFGFVMLVQKFRYTLQSGSGPCMRFSYRLRESACSQCSSCFAYNGLLWVCNFIFFFDINFIYSNFTSFIGKWSVLTLDFHFRYIWVVACECIFKLFSKFLIIFYYVLHMCSRVSKGNRIFRSLFSA